MKGPQYLGDGVYAQINDCGQLVLTTGDHSESLTDAVIYLEPEVWSALVRYMEAAP